MPRIPLTVLALAPVLSVAPAAPVPTHLMPKDPPLYYPTKAGAKMEWSQGNFTGAVVVTKVEDHGDQKIVSVSIVDRDGTLLPHMTLSVSRTGVFQVAGSDGKATNPPFCILTGAGEPGSKWETDSGVQTSVNTVHKPEWVEVPAGRFWAVRVESEYKSVHGGGKSSKGTRWFAEGVGEVKSTSGVLKSFTPGKE